MVYQLFIPEYPQKTDRSLLQKQEIKPDYPQGTMATAHKKRMDCAHPHPESIFSWDEFYASSSGSSSSFSRVLAICINFASSA